MNSQPEATGLLQKIKNAIDVHEKTIPRIFLARNSRIQLSRCTFSCKKNRRICFTNCYLKSEALLSNGSCILAQILCDVN